MKIELVELYPCASKMELERKEGEYIKSNECVNKALMGRTRKEWRTDNTNHIKEQKKQYYVTNKERLASVKKQYYGANKERIGSWRKEPFSCNLCGGSYTRSHKSEHDLTKKHQKALNATAHEPEAELQPEDENGENDKTP